MSPHHPYAALFPLLPENELEVLANDMRKCGLRSPIIRDEVGQILDGRNREAACVLANVAPRYEVFVGGDERKLQLVLSQNMNRRHLTTSQRAIVAAKLMPVYSELAKARQQASGGDKKSLKRSVPAKSPEPETKTKNKEKGDARDLAGKALKVCGKSVDSATRVLAAGIPEIVSAVESGDLSISAASALMALPADEQRTIVEAGGISAAKAAAGQIVRSRPRPTMVPGAAAPAVVGVDSQKNALMPMTNGNTADSSLDELLARAAGSSHSRRVQVIETLLRGLPDREIQAVLDRCNELLVERPISKGPPCQTRRGHRTTA